MDREDRVGRAARIVRAATGGAAHLLEILRGEGLSVDDWQHLREQVARDFVEDATGAQRARFAAAFTPAEPAPAEPGGCAVGSSLDRTGPDPTPQAEIAVDVPSYLRASAATEAGAPLGGDETLPVVRLLPERWPFRQGTPNVPSPRAAAARTAHAGATVELPASAFAPPSAAPPEDPPEPFDPDATRQIVTRGRGS